MGEEEDEDKFVFYLLMRCCKETWMCRRNSPLFYFM